MHVLRSQGLRGVPIRTGRLLLLEESGQSGRPVHLALHINGFSFVPEGGSEARAGVAVQRRVTSRKVPFPLVSGASKT